MMQAKKKKSNLNYDDEMAWKEREKAIEEESRITHKKVYTRDTQRLHKGQYYTESGNVYKNATTEDKYSEVGDYTEKSDKFLKGQEKLRSLVGTPVSSSDPTIGVGYRPLYSEDIYDVDPRERALLFFNKILELEKELKIKKDNLVIVYNAEKKLVLEKELVFIKKVMEDFEAGKISFPIRHSFSLFDQIYYKTFDSYEDIKKADTMISRDLKKYKIFNTSETSLASIREIRSKMENEILKIKKSLESKRREVEPALYLIGKCIEDTYNS